MTETRIRWTASSDAVPGYGAVRGWRGHAGSCDPYLFLITKRSLDGDDYALCTELPWMSKKRSYDPDPDELKAEAERWLTEFVSSLGASFPGEPADDESQRWQIEEARRLLAAWDEQRNPRGDIYSTERALADQVRALLAIVGRSDGPHPEEETGR